MGQFRSFSISGKFSYFLVLNLSSVSVFFFSSPGTPIIQILFLLCLLSLSTAFSMTIFTYFFMAFFFFWFYLPAFFMLKYSPSLVPLVISSYEMTFSFFSFISKVHSSLFISPCFQSISTLCFWISDSTSFFIALRACLSIFNYVFWFTYSFSYTSCFVSFYFGAGVLPSVPICFLFLDFLPQVSFLLFIFMVLGHLTGLLI